VVELPQAVRKKILLWQGFAACGSKTLPQHEYDEPRSGEDSRELAQRVSYNRKH